MASKLKIRRISEIDSWFEKLIRVWDMDMRSEITVSFERI